MEYKVRLNEFCRHGVPDFATIEKIVEFHLFPLNRVRHALGIPIYIRSGYRSIEHELKQGRSGDSQHTYQGKGASDVALQPSSVVRANANELYRLAQELVKQGFNRICFYPNEQFFHVDYKNEGSGREFYVNDAQWVRVTAGEFYERILNNDRA